MSNGSEAQRALLARTRRIVLKVGSRALAADPSIYDRLAKAVAGVRSKQRSVVLVSSGAIALGTRKLGYRTRPKEMPRLQAAAAAGQMVLMRAWEQAFEAEDITVAQVLLTHADLADRGRANNARAALGALLDAGAMPILNENDSVAVDEIKFGDNDQLAAMVVPLVDADLLVLLSDVEGLLDAQGARVSLVDDVASQAVRLIRTSRSDDVGAGGMASKVEAARRATLAGAHAVIANARTQGVLEAILAGDDVGTMFVGSPDPLSAKKHWIAFTLRPRGEIVLDRGAADAVRAKGRSVLPVGVLGVRGDFRPQDSVRLLDPDGVEIGRGLAQCAAVDAVMIAGKSKEALADGGADIVRVLVHRDEMVIWKP